jgi:hypothetical protein
MLGCTRSGFGRIIQDVYDESSLCQLRSGYFLLGLVRTGFVRLCQVSSSLIRLCQYRSG